MWLDKRKQVLWVVILVVMGCGGPLDPVVSVSAGDIAVILAAKHGKLKSGSNSIELRFESGGAPHSVEAPSLLLYMPAMGTMPEMRTSAQLSPSEVPGRFKGNLDLEMGGKWHGLVEFTAGPDRKRADFSILVQ